MDASYGIPRQDWRFLDRMYDYYQRPEVSAARGPSLWGYMPNISSGRSWLGDTGSGRRQVHLVAHDADTVKAVQSVEEKEKEEARATKAAWIGGIATIMIAGAAAFIGRASSNDHKALAEALEFREGALNGYGSADSLSIRDRDGLRPLVNKHIKNLESKVFWSRSFVALTAGAFVSAAAGFMGGMFSKPWLITAATVGIVFVLAAGAFAGVWCYTAKEENVLTPLELQHLDAIKRRLNEEARWASYPPPPSTNSAYDPTGSES